MGGGGGGNPIKRATQYLQDAANDIGKGTDKMLTGRFDEGATQFGQGFIAGANPAGAFIPSLSMGSTTAAEREARDAAKLQYDEARTLDRKVEGARRQRIIDRLSAEIALRQKAPGKNQTLLTQNLMTPTVTPSALSTGTLLTSASKQNGSR